MPATERECGNQLASAQRMGGGAKKMRETFWSPTISMLMSSAVGLVLGWLQDRAGPRVPGSPGLRVPLEPEQLERPLESRVRWFGWNWPECRNKRVLKMD